MGEDFLGTFLGDQARAKLVRVFIFNQSERAEPLTVAQIAKRSGASTQATNREIKALEKTGIIKKGKNAVSPAKKTGKSTRGKKSNRGAKQENAWFLNSEFKYLRALSSFIHEVSPLRYGNIVGALKNSGRLATVVVSGCFVGDTTRPVDIIVVADNLNETRLLHAIKGLAPLLGRELRYSAFSTIEFSYRLTIQDRLIRDTLDYPHLVLLDRAHLL